MREMTPISLVAFLYHSHSILILSSNQEWKRNSFQESNRNDVRSLFNMFITLFIYRKITCQHQELNSCIRSAVQIACNITTGLQCPHYHKVEFIHNQQMSHDQHDNVLNKKSFTKSISLQHIDTLSKKHFQGNVLNQLVQNMRQSVLCNKMQ